MTDSVTPENFKERSVWVVVAAAGVGSRTGLAIPKQYSMISGYPVICHILTELLEFPLIAGVMVVVAKEDKFWPRIYSAFTEKRKKDENRIHFCQGGEQRADSVLAGLKALENIVEKDDWILVHDAARPGLNAEDLESVFNALATLENIDGLLPGLKSTDTLKQLDENGVVKKTLDRNKIWQAQTPQCFKFSQLKKVLQNLSEKLNITDESSAMEAAGFSTKIILGSIDNFKITNAEDLQRMTEVIGKQLATGKRQQPSEYFSLLTEQQN